MYQNTVKEVSASSKEGRKGERFHNSIQVTQNAASDIPICSQGPLVPRPYVPPINMVDKRTMIKGPVVAGPYVPKINMGNR